MGLASFLVSSGSQLSAAKGSLGAGVDGNGGVVSGMTLVLVGVGGSGVTVGDGEGGILVADGVGEGGAVGVGKGTTAGASLGDTNTEPREGNVSARY